MLLTCNTQLCFRLKEIAEKPLENWVAADMKFLLEAYGHTLPPIQKSQTPRLKGRVKIKCKDYFYGYQTIMESKGIPGVFERKIEKLPLPQGKNFLEENRKQVYPAKKVKSKCVC